LLLLSDFVAGVPKELMLYGSVRALNHWSHFAIGRNVFKMRDLGLRLGTEVGM